MTSTKSEKLAEFTQRAVNVFKESAHVPSVSNARVFRQGEGERGYFEVEATWTLREMERGKNIAFTKSYFVQKRGLALEKLCDSAFQSDATQIMKVSYSGDNSVKAALVKEKTAKTEPGIKQQQYIEVWSGERLIKTISVDTLKKHSQIHEDNHFGSFQLSADGHHLLYIAEMKKLKTCSFFKRKYHEINDLEDTSKHVLESEYVFESHWGEMFSSVVNPLPVVLDVDSEDCTVIDVTNIADISCGQAQWVPSDEEGVVFVGWENQPQKLGMLYSIYRRSALYHWKNGVTMRLTGKRKSVFSPRFNPEGTRLVFFECIDCGHRSCAALKLIEWNSKSVTTVIDIVKRPEGRDGFAGYYSFFLPERCWDSKGERLISEEIWGSSKLVTCLDVINKKVTKVTSTGGTWVVLDVSHDLILAQFSTPTTPPQLLIGALPEDETTPISWTELSMQSRYQFLDGLSWELLNFDPKDDSGLTYDAIFLSPKATPKASPPPLIVFPHGGPHIIFPTRFLSWTASFAALGFAVLLVNYRGSIGYGQDGVFSLVGKIGSQDVSEVHAAAVSLVERGVVNKDQIVLLGGSHAGFIACHLMAMYPDFYKAASMRNPVVNLASLIGSGATDIPDWTYTEFGMTYDPAEPPTSDTMLKFLSVSPITSVDKIKAAVMIVLGAQDLRVPNTQGLQLYHSLKARAVPVKLLYYPEDSHPISSVSSDGDFFISTASWFYQHTQVVSELTQQTKHEPPHLSNNLLPGRCSTQP